MLARRLPRRPFLVSTHWWVALVLLAFPVLIVALLPREVPGLEPSHLVAQVLLATVLTRVFVFWAARWFRTNVQAVLALVTRDCRVVVAAGEGVVEAVAERLALGEPAHEPGRRPPLLPLLGVAATAVFVAVGTVLGGRPAAFLAGILLGLAVSLVQMLLRVHRSGVSGEDRLEPVVIVPVLAGYRRATGQPLPARGVPVQDLYASLREHPDVAAPVVQRIRGERLFPMLTARASFTEGIALWLP